MLTDSEVLRMNNIFNQAKAGKRIYADDVLWLIDVIAHLLTKVVSEVPHG